jgi:hypothetical protein
METDCAKSYRLARAARRAVALGVLVVSLKGASPVGWNSAVALPTVGYSFGTDAPLPVQKGSDVADMSIASDGEHCLAVAIAVWGDGVRGCAVRIGPTCTSASAPLIGW